MKRNLLIALLIGVVTISGCGKYEDGPGFTLLTKKMRVTGEWKQVKELYNEVEMETSVRTWNILKNSEIEWKETFNDEEIISTYSWMFSVKKENFLIDRGGETPDEYIILKLTNKEFWVKLESAHEEVLEYHFEKQE